MGPRYEGVEDWVVATVTGDGDDLGFAGCASLEVLDAIGLGWVVGAEFGGADYDFEVGGLVQTFGFAGTYPGDDAFDRHTYVSSIYYACSGVVVAGCGAFDIRDGLAPVLEEGGGD